ncbi:MAG: cupin domain-containing protein [Methylococcaceae bacterium]|nr:cupin domain-containing protein [Methylococcaceae bacterium]
MTDWVARLGLEPHPEGGWFRRIHTEARRVATPAGSRPIATSIHYLLDRDRPRGVFHRNRSTILHYLQDGGPVDYFLLDERGSLRRVRLGRAFGEELFLAVPGGLWKASRLPPESDYALVSEVVVPGFDLADHAFLTRELLADLFPRHLDDLADLLRPD